MIDLVPTQDVLKETALEGGVSRASVAINYNLLKGAAPTVGIRDPKHAEDLVRSLGWRLTLREVERIDAVCMEGKTTVLWPHG
jgi:aryl-alcohol dehydrogenase-like predicted oxidoreductase